MPADILATIVDDVRRRRATQPDRDRSSLAPDPARRSRFVEALAGPDLAVIAECKRRSPSQGAIAGADDVVDRARAYAAGGAAALSILTEVDHFGGAPADLEAAAAERGLGVVQLSAPVEMEIAQLEESEEAEFVESLGLEEPAKNRFIRAAYALIDLISMLTAGEDECRAWPVPRGTAAPRAAGKIHSDIERGFIRAEVTRYEDLIELGSEAKCKEAGKLRV